MPHSDSAATSAVCRSWRAALIVALLLILPTMVRAQQVQLKAKPNLSVVPEAETLQQEPVCKIIDPVERMPSFRGGGSVELVAYIQQQIHWPKSATRLRGGRIFVSFVIDTTGQVGDVKIIRGLHPLLDAEVVRVIQKLTGFTQPLQSNGKRHATGMTVPVQFKIR